MRRSLRSFLAVAVGYLAASFCIALVETVSHATDPLSFQWDATDINVMREVFSKMPPGAFVLVLLAETLGTLVGAFVSVVFARRAPLVHGGIVGGVFLLLSVVNVIMIPHPIWFKLLAPVLVLPATYLGATLARRLLQERKMHVGDV